MISNPLNLISVRRNIPRTWLPKKIAITDDDFHIFHVAFFTSVHPYGPIWAHMDPYGPVYHFMLLLYELYVVFTLFYMILDVFIHDFWDYRHMLKTNFTHMFITVLELSKDHFASPPAPKFCFICKFGFPIIWNVLEN